MPDRIIRDELLASDRWLDLPTDTHRVLFLGLVLLADDFGNLEGGRRLWRTAHSFTQIKSFEDFARFMSELQDADLARRYEVDGRELWHLPRFRPQHWYIVRKFPASPWDQEIALGKSKRVINRGLAKNQSVDATNHRNVAETSPERNRDVPKGVGVELQNLNQKPLATYVLPQESCHPQAQPDLENLTSKANPRPGIRPDETVAEYAKRLSRLKLPNR